jgi:uncharacterized protein YbaR (Trm112 family)
MKMKKETTYFLVCPKCKKIHNVDEWANHIKESERERVLKEVESIINKMDAKCEGCDCLESKHATFPYGVSCCPECNHKWIDRKKLIENLKNKFKELKC